MAGQLHRHWRPCRQQARGFWRFCPGFGEKWRDTADAIMLGYHLAGHLAADLVVAGHGLMIRHFHALYPAQRHRHGGGRKAKRQKCG